MLPDPKLKTLHELIDNVSREELIWINGYLQGLVSSDKKNGHHAENESAGTSVRKLTILYGTETGNSRKAALQLVQDARKSGLVSKCSGMDQYRLPDLAREQTLILVISTQGEGEPPEAAKRFYEHVMGSTGRLEHLEFAVLALGDSAYPLFCKAGTDIDSKLFELGGKRLLPVRTADVDFEPVAHAWSQELLASLRRVEQATPAPKPAASKSQGRTIYAGTILQNINLHDRGSPKSTCHVEIGTDVDVEYEAGDALAVVPENSPAVVDHIIAITGVNPDLELSAGKHSGTLRKLLLQHLNICYLHISVIKKYATLTGQQIPDTRMDLVDLLRIYPVSGPDQFAAFVPQLTPIAPRLYTIATSPRQFTRELHITVSRHSFLVHDENRYGLCSTFLGDMPIGSTVYFYIHRNKHFRIPSPEKDMIMIGPGTGVAPFRAFLQDREATGATGKSWFFFGEDHFQTDFLYQTEMQQWLQTEVLHRINLAFSKERLEPRQVHDSLWQEGAELYAWLEQGASVFLSGEKEPMSHEVEKTWLYIIETHGRKTADEARQYWEELKKSGRYQKDVY